MTSNATHSPAEILEHTGWLRSLARQLVADPNTADDVVQNTLMAALAWEGVPHEGLRNWLAGVARNMARQIGRGESRRTLRQIKAAVPEALPSAGEMVELVESQRLLAAAVLELDEPYRSTIFLRYFEELTPRDIAEQQGLPGSTVRVRLKRGLELLRERLDSDAVDADQHWSLLLLPLVTPSKGEALAAPTAAGTLPTWAARLFTANGLKAGLLLGVVASCGWVVLNTTSRDTERAPGLVIDAPDNHATRTPSNTHTDPLPDQRVVSAPPTSPPTTALAVDSCCLVGRVFDPQGEPLANARVTAVGAHRRSPSILVFDATAEWSAETRTASDGSYRIPVESNRPFLVRAHHEGFAVAESPATFAGEAQDLVLNAGYELAIRIREFGSRTALEGVVLHVKSVDAYRVPSAWSMNATTDADGVARLAHLPAGKYQATAQLAGHADLSFKGEVFATQNSAQEQWLSLATSIHGVVVDGETLEPLEGIRVEGPAGSAVTDHRGQFQLDGFDAQARKAQPVIVRTPGHSPTARYVRVSANEAAPFLEIRLPRAIRVSGRVVDSDGSPISGAKVGHRGRFSPNPARAERHDGETLSDENGRFELQLHYRAQYTVGVSAPGYAVTNTRIVRSDPNDLLLDLGDLVLHNAGSISGIVRNRKDNRDAPDTIEVELLFRGDFLGGPSLLVQVVSVAPDGTFQIDNLAPGAYGLTLHGADPTGKRPTVALVRRTVVVTEGNETAEVELSPVDPIRGRVSLPDGSPGLKVRVVAKRSIDGSPIAVSSTNTEGFFKLLPEGDGPFVLIADDPALLWNPGSLSGVQASANNVSMRLEARTTPFHLRGKIVDTHGNPVPNASLRLIRQISGDNLFRPISIAADGSFDIANLDDEPYTLYAFTPNAEYEFTSLFDARPNGDPIILQMKGID